VLSMVFKDFKDKLWVLRTFKDRVNFFRILRNLRTSGRPEQVWNDDRLRLHDAALEDSCSRTGHVHTATTNCFDGATTTFCT